MAILPPLRLSDQDEAPISVQEPRTIGPFRFPDQLWVAAAGDPRLRGQEAAKDALGVIAHHAAIKGFCYLSDARIAEMTGRDAKTVNRAVKLLDSLGYVSRQRGTFRGNATVYILPLDRDSEDLERGAPTTTFDAQKGGAHDHLSNGKGGRRCPERGAPVSRKGGAGVPKGGRSYAPPTSLTEVEPRSKPHSRPHACEGTEKADLDLRSRSGDRDSDENAESTAWLAYFLADGESSASVLEPPPIPPDATLLGLITHAHNHGRSPGVGAEVIRRMAERLSVDPEKKGGCLGKHLWPVAKGEVASIPDPLMRAARWAEKALDPRMVADKPPLDGFLLIASGQQDVPWPIAGASEAAEVKQRREAPYRPKEGPSLAAAAVAEALGDVPERRTSTQAEQFRQLPQVAGRRVEWRPSWERRRPRVSLSIEELAARAENDPILAGELARRKRIAPPPPFDVATDHATLATAAV